MEIKFDKKYKIYSTEKLKNQFKITKSEDIFTGKDIIKNILLDWKKQHFTELCVYENYFCENYKYKTILKELSKDSCNIIPDITIRKNFIYYIIVQRESNSKSYTMSGSFKISGKQFLELVEFLYSKYDSIIFKNNSIIMKNNSCRIDIVIEKSFKTKCRGINFEKDMFFQMLKE